MTVPTPRLWEMDHPYYCVEGNFFAPPNEGLHTVYNSWAEFLADRGDTDPDYNLVFRWDWRRADPNEEDEHASDRLLVYWVIQREAILCSTECFVTEADEPAVRAWLKKRAEKVRALWEPLLASPNPGPEPTPDSG